MSNAPIGTACGLVLTVVYMVLMTVQITRTYLVSIRPKSRTVNLKTAYELLLCLHFGLMGLVARTFEEGALTISLESGTFDTVNLLWLNIAILIPAVALAILAREPVRAPELALIFLAATPAALDIGAVGGWFICINASYFTGRAMLLLYHAYRVRAGRINSLSPGEAVNTLPSGIMGGDESGQVIFMNDAMRDILSSLGLRTNLGDARLDFQMLNSRWREHPRGRVELADGRTYLTTIGHRIVDGRTVYFGIAFDYTEENNLQKTVDEANQALARQNRELSDALLQLQETAANEAALQMRARMHDVVGQRLSILHRCLEDDDLSDAAVDRLRPILSSLLTDLSPSNIKDAPAELNAIIKAFELADVAIAVEGSLPANSSLSRLAVRIIRETATNAVKHAHAKTVAVVLDEDAGGLYIGVSNDGKRPAGTIVEGTGLSGLRHSVEKYGGHLVVSTEERFQVDIYIPASERRS